MKPEVAAAAAVAVVVVAVWVELKPDEPGSLLLLVARPAATSPGATSC